MNECPEELIIRLAVAASSRCIHTVNELLNDGHFENARRVRTAINVYTLKSFFLYEQENTSDSPTELKPLLSPYFYVVEMAIFSPTFWHRYDRTWWFDKTKTNVIEGMYKVVHRGFNSEVSPEMEETAARLQQLFDTLHIDNGTLSKVYGLPNTSSAADVVAVLLESKTSLRAWNFELTLLLSGFKTLERQLERVKVASGSCKKFVERFLQLQRAIPELEHSPGANFLIIRQLHEILRVSIFLFTWLLRTNNTLIIMCLNAHQDASEVVTKLSSPGWLQ
ncbi:hypothetical protein PHMEG_00025468 [Phytophthora megakarya]|uniref:Uncharacterized protein n=1 Tax=Phytophthora megakarya TaxID=4795 RepID=A0A225VCQ5_9STRA|nr:hypothetical protein PHMEG_00025468 [Phytophthora megakarya]